jgi:hypothetical protein
MSYIRFFEDFESANLITNDWVINNGIYSSVGLTITNAIVDTISLEFTGGSVVYGTQLTETAAFSDPDHISTATICVEEQLLIIFQQAQMGSILII